MALILIWVFVISLVVAMIAYAVRYGKEKERHRDQLIAQENRQKDKCRVLINDFARNHPQIEKNVVSVHELERKATLGETPEKLAEYIEAKTYYSDLFRLGTEQGKSLKLPVILPDDLRDKHVYIVGKSGYGKTTLLRSMIEQDLIRGSGIAVIAPEAELILEEILPVIPERRIDDVIYFNPADRVQPVVLNPLHVHDNESFDLHIDETLTVLKRLTDEGGPRMNHILHSALYALSERPGSTLLDIALLLDRKDESLRREIINTTADDLTRRFFEQEYPQMPADAHLPILNRFGRIVRSEFVRTCLCPPKDSSMPFEQVKSRLLNIRKAMDEGKIMLFNLSDGMLGQEASQLIGQLIVAKFQTATMSRVNVPKAHRKPYYLYLDEFQNFCGVASESYEKILSRARKYGLGLILAHQQTSQLPGDLLHEILGNVSSIVAFQLSHADSSKLSKEIHHSLANDLQTRFMNLKVGESICSIGGNVFHMTTNPPNEKGNPEKVNWIIKRSREQYGIPRVSSSSSYRQGLPKPPDPLSGLDPGEVL